MNWFNQDPQFTCELEMPTQGIKLRTPVANNIDKNSRVQLSIEAKSRVYLKPHRSWGMDKTHIACETMNMVIYSCHKLN